MLIDSLSKSFASSLLKTGTKTNMQITKLIKDLCDGDRHYLRGHYSVEEIDNRYSQYTKDFEKKKKKYFKKYAKECKLANKRMSENKNRYGN